MPPTPAHLQEALHCPVEPPHEEHPHCQSMCHQAYVGVVTKLARLHVTNEMIFKYGDTVVHITAAFTVWEPAKEDTQPR